KESFFLAPLTYSYIYFVNQEKRIFLILAITTLASALVMYVEKEIREDLKEDYFEVTPWLYPETANLAFWMISNFYIYYLFIFTLEWQSDATLAGLGLVNLAYGIGWAVDKVYAYKYSKYYSDITDDDNEDVTE
ncbi:hypothetical protein, partial [Paractinoplanes durhamensis]